MGKAFICLLIFSSVALGALSPEEAIKGMMKGINLGNTFDAPDGETTWGNPLTQKYFFDDWRNAGYNAIRIPVTWDKHASYVYPYNIDSNFISRVQEVVYWALNRGFFVIINCHHEAWLKQNPTPEFRKRFEGIWTQISQNFKGFSDHVLFEILNEPYPMELSMVNQINNDILTLIRKTNPTRLVIFAGDQWSSGEELKKAAIPKNNGRRDSYLIANYHEYSPFDFANSGDPNLKWGSNSQRKDIENIFVGVKNHFQGQGIGVMMNEYGCKRLNDYNSRMTFYQTYVDNSVSTGISIFAWDDGYDYQIYDRRTRQWVGDVAECMTSDPFTIKGYRAICWDKMSGVDRETTQDNSREGGKNVKSIKTGDWMSYMINVPSSGKYKVEYRVASDRNKLKGIIRIEHTHSSIIYGRIEVPRTWGWQYWTTISHEITLQEGPQNIALTAEIGGWSLNWFRMSKV